MLNDLYRNSEGLAWILDSRHKKALQVQGWRERPEGLESHFYAPDFALFAEAPWLWGETIEVPNSILTRGLPKLIHRAEPASGEFARVFEDIQARIAAGAFSKVVPIVEEELEFNADLCANMFPGAFQVHEHQVSYGFEFGGEGLCGVTPEVLFSVEDQVLQTMALAGTGPSDGPSLLSDPKERQEHDLVVEHIVSELKRWGSPDVGPTQERTYGMLKHLYTPIHLDLEREPEFMELVVRLHPTAALGGWPRSPAVEWLQTQPFQTSRGRFGAPFGYVDRERMLCVVAIRGLQWKGPCARVAAGCGIVAQSQVLKEWEELGLKRASVWIRLGASL
ncbi:MAG: chorismate-binding protein [Bdellovibrionales bacterium]